MIILVLVTLLLIVSFMTVIGEADEDLILITAMVICFLIADMLILILIFKKMAFRAVADDGYTHPDCWVNMRKNLNNRAVEPLTSLKVDLI